MSRRIDPGCPKPRAATRRNPRRRDVAVVGVGLVAAASLAAAQGPPPAAVRYTEARQQAVRRSVTLTGTVEARTSSVVASEVEGLVVAIVAREGQTVRKGQPLVRIRRDQLELRLAAAEAQLREAAARRDLARSNLERSRELYGQKILSQGQLDDSSSEFAAWQGRVDQLEAEIGRIRLDVERSDVPAPFSGVVVAERTEVGEWVGQGDPVAELLSLDDLEVRVAIPEQYFPSVKRGAPARVTFEALPGYDFEGRVAAVVPRADPQARTFPVRVRLESTAGRVGVGMLAQVAFGAGDEYQATVIPKDAVIVRGADRFVYRLTSDDTVERVSVQTGTGVGEWIEVSGGIDAGAKVVTRGNERLSPGQQVTGQPEEYARP